MASEIDQLPQSQRPPPKVADDGAPPTPPATADGTPTTTLTNGQAADATPPAPSRTTNPAPLLPGDTESDAPFADADDGPDSDPGPRTLSPITSPPYWKLNNNGGNPPRPHNNNNNNNNNSSHNRTASAESVLPPGAITLQDNEDVSSDAGGRSSDVSARDRNKACWAKSVEVVNHVVVNGSTTNIGAFVVWNIRVETLSGSFMNIRKRYSEFDDFRRRLVQTFPGFEAAVPVLPPKSVISKFRPRFLEKRRAGLQYFLNCILLNPEFSGSPVLKEFLFS